MLNTFCYKGRATNKTTNKTKCTNTLYFILTTHTHLNTITQILFKIRWKLYSCSYEGYWVEISKYQVENKYQKKKLKLNEKKKRIKLSTNNNNKKRIILITMKRAEVLPCVVVLELLFQLNK